MSTDKTYTTDVLIVGGGMGGLFAAIEARRAGAAVTVVEKAYAGKSGGGALGASWFAVFNPEWGHNLDTFVSSIVSMGEYLNHRDWVKTIVTESYARYRDLNEWGVPFHSKKGRAPHEGAHAMQLEKQKYMPVLRAKALEVGARIVDRVMITDLMKQGDAVVGAVGFDAREGDFYVFQAKAVILATGSGTFKVPGWMDAYWTADGDAMSYRAGAEIVSKEFGGKDAGVLKEYASARVGVLGGYLRFENGQGETYFERYAAGNHTEHRRMLYSLFEVHAGRGPIMVNFDAATPAERRRAAEAQKASGLDWLAERVGFDVRTVGKVELSYGSWVGLQPSTGGTLINLNCESCIPGLYVVGDGAGTRMCGACYAPMGYGLAGAAVTGHRAGHNAAEFALKVLGTTPTKEAIAVARETVFRPIERKGGFSSHYVADMLRNLMVPYYVMQIKSGERLRAALTMVEFIEGHLVPQMRADDPHDLRIAHEVRNMALNAEMVLRASLFRTESRGSHYREDCPQRSDPDWLAWTILQQDDGRMKLGKQPIPKEWWPDLSRPYAERYELRFPAEISAPSES